MSELETVQDLLRRHVPPGAAAEAVPVGPEWPIASVESPMMATARPLRRREFSAGRAAARAALVSLGHERAPIPAAQDRSPVWPDGISGSIAHDRQMAVAVVSDKHHAIGVDIEPVQSISPELVSEFCGPEDDADDPIRVFCAKEAVYKAQYPHTQQIFGFDRLRVKFKGRKFRAEFTEKTGCYEKGDAIHGRCLRRNGMVLAIAWEDSAPR